MAASAGLPSSTDSPAELPATQLALAISQRTHARLKTGSIITGGRVRNGAQVFLSGYRPVSGLRDIVIVKKLELMSWLFH